MNNKLETLNIHKDESLSNIESNICKLFTGDEYKLRLPSKLGTKGALGVEVAIIQLLGTWLQCSGKKIFHSHQNADPKDFKELCSSIYGIAVLSMAGEIWDKQKTVLPRNAALINAKNTIESIRVKDFDAAFKSRYFGIPCIKKPSYDKEFDMPVYNGDEVIEADAFLKLTKAMLKNTISGVSRFERLDEFIGVDELSDLLWELFKNTHDHGRLDNSGNELPNNFRSLIVQQLDISDKYFKSWLGTSPSAAQKDFFDGLKGQGEKKHILDISVVDFGKGFVELAKNKSELIDDVEVLLKCLELGWSRFEKKNRGAGLNKVLAKVNKHKGWLRVRTGNLLLEKAYLSDDKIEITAKDIRRMDCEVVGTSFHISIPLNKSLVGEG